MVTPMASTVKKVTVALGREEYAWAREQAERTKTSVSAVLTKAARDARETQERCARQDAAWAKVEAWLTDGRGFTEEELEAARRELDDA